MNFLSIEYGILYKKIKLSETLNSLIFDCIGKINKNKNMVYM